jgi:O-glycosyl hydrolase
LSIFSRPYHSQKKCHIIRRKFPFIIKTKKMITIATRTRLFRFAGIKLTLFFLFFAATSRAQTVTPWMTTGDQTVLLQQQAAVNFGSNTTPTASTVTVSTGTTYQTMDGFGWALTEGSAELINSLASTQQNALLNELFNPSTGLSSALVRISIGASDLSSSSYSYDETAGDVNLTNFSLSGPDLTNVVPVLKKILLINPSIKILATPWSAPRWMKSNDAWVGGSLQTQYYAAYALYFVKYFQAMAAQGINIWAITPQNEPENPNNEPSMTMTSTEETNFINQQLGPQMAAAGYGGIKIIGYDHNCDDTAYPIAVCNNSSYVDGAAFHLYAGNISALTTVHNATNKNVYFTEQFTGSPSNFSGDFGWHTQNVIIGSANNWAKGIIEWNIASNPSVGPHTPGGCTSCLGAVTVSSSTSYTHNVQYYLIGQVSKFAKTGALRLSASSNNSTVASTGFRNPDGSIVLLVYNAGTTSNTVRIISGSTAFDYTIPAASAVTFNWTTGPPVAVTGVSVSPSSASVAVNNSTQLTATVAPANATNKNVSWSSSSSAVATVSPGGLVTGIAAGTATITVTTADGNKAATSAITVTVIATTGVTVNPTTASLFTGQTQQLTATVSPSNASNKNITWISANTSVATVSSTGLVTAVAPGTATITANTVSGNFTATSAITVKNQQPYTGTPISLPGIVEAENFDLGGQNVAYNDADPTNDGGQYRPNEGVDIAQISGTSGFTVGWTVNGEWLEYTVNVTAGTYSILATVASPNTGGQIVVKLDGTTLATVTVPNTGDFNNFQTVTLPNIPFTGGNNKILRFEIVNGNYNIDKVEVRNVAAIPVTGVTVSPSTASLSVGSTMQLTATVSPANATNQNITWSSGNTAVATVAVSGLVTGVAAGAAVIIVTTQDGSKTSTSNITVTAAATGFPGYYNVFSKNSGKGLDVTNNATNSGAQIQQYDVTNGGGANQRWSFTSAGGNNYYIKVKSTQMCLAPSNLGTTNGERVQQRTCGTTPEFQWTVTPLGGGLYQILNVNSGKSLDVENVSTSNGANIQVWDYAGGLNQQWTFTQVETVTSLANTLQQGAAANLAVTDKAIVSPNPASRYFTILFGSGGIVELYGANGKLVFKKQFNSSQPIDISGLAAGLYFVKITSKGGTHIDKLIKQ